MVWLRMSTSNVGAVFRTNEITIVSLAENIMSIKSLGNPMLTDKVDETFRRYPTTFRSAVEVHAACGRETAIAIRTNPALISSHYRRFISDFVKYYDRTELSSLAFALNTAMASFADNHSKAPAREEVLVGLFRASISEAIGIINDNLRNRGHDSLPLNILAADLNIKSREKKTGGDIALIVDICAGESGRTLVPICFQAKRAAPTEGQTVNIRRFNKSDPDIGDHQLTALERFAEEGANCAYLFFNNHKDFRVDSPILPLVKAVEHVAAAASPLDVDLAVDTIDVASYVMHLFNGGGKAVTSMSSLQPLLTSLVEGDISHLVVLSSDCKAWENLPGMLGEKYVPASKSPFKGGLVALELAFGSPHAYERKPEDQSKGYNYTPGGFNSNGG